MTRIDRIQARIEGQNPLADEAKDFALAEHIGGVPLEELKILVGEAVTVMLASNNDVAGFSVGETGYASPYTAFQPLTNFPTADILRIADILHLIVDIRSVGGLPDVGTDPYGRFNFYLFADDWTSLTPAEVGDTLSIATGTGHLVRAMQEPHVSVYSPIGTVEFLLGRTATNEILLQHHNDHVLRLQTAQIAATNNIGMAASFEVYAGGMLGSRIAALRAFDSTHRIAIKGRFATRPAAPVPGLVLYDGLEPSFSSPDSGWVLARDADPTGNDPLWYAATTADFDHVYRTWTVDNQEWLIAGTDVAVIDTSVEFQVQFAEAVTGPWHVPRTADDEWVRLREPDGTWRSFPFNVDHNHDPQLLTTQVFTDFSMWTRRTAGFRPSDYQFFVFEITNQMNGERHYSVPIPRSGIELLTVYTMGPAQEMQARVGALSVAWARGRPMVVFARDRPYNEHGENNFGIGFERDPDDHGLCTHMVFGRWINGANFTFRLWGF